METKEAGELYVIAMNEQARLISNTPAYMALAKLLLPIPGDGVSIFEILSTGEDGLVAILNKIEGMNFKVTNDVQLNALTVLKNLTTVSNLGYGFKMNEYDNLVKYVVITHYKCHNGQMVSEKELVFTDDKPNKEQEEMIEMIFEYPWLLTMILLEGQSFSVVPA